MEQDLMRDTEHHMSRSLDVLRTELATIRTGRANPAIIEHVSIEYYGAPTPLLQLATITSPDPRQLVVQPWDRSALGSIEKAIRQSDLGFNPTNDGSVIRILIPQLTEERRRDLVKLVHKRVEEAKVAIRNVRRDSNERLRSLRREKEISEDEEKRAQDHLQKLTDRYIHDADGIGRSKETEMMEV
ncbi:MAG TPA: ribosome recycling factor [Chloroflexota bacterium]|nr:ribosome recycling factor [Chloroflexota bacterium]